MKSKIYFNYWWFIEGSQLIFQIVNNKRYPMFQSEIDIE